VDRLGFFTEVGIDTQEVAGAPDQVDLTVNVVEKPTGSISLGAGVSSSEGLGFTFGFKQENAFGSGNSLALELNTSKVNRTVVLSTTDPYFTENGVSRTFDVYQRTSRPYDDVDTYAVETTGGSVRFGLPVTENDTVYVGLGAEKIRIIEGTLLPTVYQDYANEFGYSTVAVPLSVGWSRDTRDSALVPSTGRVLRASGEWSVGGDLRYARGTAQYQQFIPISRKVTAAFNSEIALGAGTGGTTYPVFKNYYAGGLGSVRGFEQGSLTTAAQRAGSSTATGGTKRITFSAEVLTPLPGGGNDRTLRVYGFVDAGGIYGANESIQLGDMRSSYGVGISWISPVGPLRLAFSRPITKFDGDKIQGLQFQIGTTF
jgi:outer membrane protein insertion porin family